MYEIYKGLSVELNKVTPKSLQSVKDLGLLVDNGNTVNEYEIYLNKDKLLKWVSAIFNITEDQLKILGDNWQEVDIEKVVEAHHFFFGKLRPSMDMLMKWLEPFLSQNQKTTTSSKE